MPSFEDTIWHCSRCGAVKTDRERKTCHKCAAEFGKDVDLHCPHGYAPDVHCDDCGRRGFPNH